jgi:hypothetical protein
MVFVRQERCVDPHHPDPVFVLIPLEMEDEPCDIRRQGDYVVFEVQITPVLICQLKLTLYRQMCKTRKCVCTQGFSY